MQPEMEDRRKAMIGWLMELRDAEAVLNVNDALELVHLLEAQLQAEGFQCEAAADRPTNEGASGSVARQSWDIGIALIGLASDATNRDYLGEAGAIPVVIELLQTATRGWQAAAWAEVLQSLAADHPNNRHLIIHGGAVRLLITACYSDTELLRACAAEALAALCPDPQAIVKLMEAGMVPALAHLLESKVSTTRFHGAQLAHDFIMWAATKEGVTAGGCIPPLVNMLQSEPESEEESAAQVLALGTLESLSYFPDARGPIADAGAVEALIQLFSHSQEILRCGSIATLANLVQENGLQKRLVKVDIIPALVEALRNGTEKVQAVAAAAIVNLTMFGSNTAQSRRIGEAGAVGPLVQLCGSSLLAVQENAAMGLANLAVDGVLREHIAEAGALPILEGLLQSSAETVQKSAIAAFVNMTIAACNWAAVAELGVIEKLLQLSRSGSEEVRGCALGPIANLAIISELHGRLVEAGALPALQEQLQSDSPVGQRNAAATALSLSMDGTYRGMIADAGAIPHLVELCDSSPQESRWFSVGAIMNLAVDDAFHARLIEAGALLALKRALHSPSEAASSRAAGAFMSFTKSEARRVEVADAGAIEALLELCTSDSEEVQASAAGAVANLAADHTLHKRIIEAGVVPVLLEVLTSATMRAVRESAACLAMNLALNPKTSSHLTPLSPILLGFANDPEDQELQGRASVTLFALLRQRIDEYLSAKNGEETFFACSSQSGDQNQPPSNTDPMLADLDKDCRAAACHL